MLVRYYLLPLLFFLGNFVKSDENIYVLNHNRPLNIVSDKFLSMSIDPAILLTNINLSNISLRIASHMSPAFVRIAGPSTEFVTYVDTDDKSVELGSSDVDSVTVTPSVWFAINEWFAMANLTPVFGINDAETAMGVWNPKSILPLLELSDKFNVSCMWQLGYDCSNKSSIQYIEDLRILRHILDAFQDRRDSWKIVGSNIRECTSIHDTRRNLNELKGIADCVMWEHSENDIDLSKFKDDFVKPFVTFGKNYPKIWTTGSKSHHTVTFETALQWAKEVGEASRQGFNVILRQPRIHEFFVDTPVFWFSLIYKTLVGNIVLDLKSTGTKSNAEAFAYCAKNQNNFIHSGAMTLMMVNQEETECKIHLKMSTLPSNIEVQSYILTTKSDKRSIYLNNERLKADMLESDKIVLTPKLRRAKPTNGISLFVPARSIAFFVLPGAKIPTCVEEDDELTLLMEEIKEDQELPFSEEIAVDLKSRLSHRNLSLKEMQLNLEEELKADEKYYNVNRKGKGNEKLDDVLENLKDEYDNEECHPKLQFILDDETRKAILERAKLARAQKKITESEQRLLDLGKIFMSKNFPKHVEETTQFSEEFFSHSDDSNTPEKKSHLMDIAKSRTTKLRELLANKPKHKFSSPDTKNNHINNIDHFKLGHSKSSSIHPKTLNEQLRDILGKPKSNLLRKHSTGEKSYEKSAEVELELSSAEIQKVLMDRVKSRAAKTNIRFTNEELVDIMKKATARLKHDHILKHRSRRSIRSKRDINMKLLNEVAKDQDSKKGKKSRNTYDRSVESIEIVPGKSTKSKLFGNAKQTIVNPFRGISKDRQQSELKDRSKSDVTNLEVKDDWDYYSDEDNSEEASNFHHIHEFKPIIRKSETLGVPLNKEVGKIKMASIPKIKTRTHDPDEGDDLYKKFSRLDAYFRNAKEFQEKFDDIDFSDESDYGNIDSSEKSMRLKRNNRDIIHRDCNKEMSNCDCKHSDKKNSKCECVAPTLEKIMKPLLGNVSGENLAKYFQQNSRKYVELAESLNKKLDNKTPKKRNVSKVKRSAYKNDDFINYKPLREFNSEWNPQDVMSLHKHLTLPSKYHVSKTINDLPFYEHLLHGRSIKRSIFDNEISYDSSEKKKIDMNNIKKDTPFKSRISHNLTDYKLVFPNSDKLELKKDNQSVKIIFEHKHNHEIEKSDESDIKNNTITEKDNVPSAKNSTNSDLLNRNMLSRNRVFKSKNASNIQQIPKKPIHTAFQKIIHHLTSFVGQMGSKFKDYFRDLLN